MDTETKEHLQQITARLDRLETAIRRLDTSSDPAEPLKETPAAMAAPAQQQAPNSPQRPAKQINIDEIFHRLAPSSSATTREAKVAESDLQITQIMGWAGITLLVLAAAYLIRLVYDSGWLTPQRQVFIAVVSAIAMIGAGLRLRRTDDKYASLAAAGGVVVLFLSIYGAHLYYHLISANMATAAVVLTCLMCLWLGSVFASDMLGLFSVLGSYSAPFLLPVLSGSVADLAIYFTAWSILFCGYGLAIKNRRAYLLAGYLALVAFEMSWKLMQAEDWLSALWFQLAQFAIFLATAIVFSVRSAQPMKQSEAYAHLPLLLIFYTLQYSLLHSHVPNVAPWVAIGSGLVLLLAYLIAESVIQVPLRVSGYIVGTYCAWVIFHAVYVELLPDDWALWLVLLATPVCAITALREKDLAPVSVPFLYLIGGLFFINFLRTLLTPGHLVQNYSMLISLLYTAELYAAYFIGRSRWKQLSWTMVALCAAHLDLMRLAFDELPNAFAVSFAWGALGLATLMAAYWLRDKKLGNSSVAIFFACILKVLAFDLSDATALMRIGSLMVVGISVFVGGLIYKKFMGLEGKEASA